MKQVRATPALMVGALGVVFGDIGTSPLYALRGILAEGNDLSRDTVYGLTSMVIWSLVIIVTVLYLNLLMRVDNEGEGGLLALVALVRRTTKKTRTISAVSVLGMVGASMFLGDSVITPAISVLSAAEGLEVASPSLDRVVLPVAVVILIGVFVLQQVGSGRIGKVYGPVMLVWFGILGVTGAASLARDPQVLAVVSPHWAVLFIVHNPLTAFLSLGSVVLAVTGAEALYTDLGHFGHSPILWSWVALVLPALLLAYLGEAAAVLRDPSAASEPFYAVVPGWATIPVLVVATLATIIASEAVIAGAFTVIHQAGGLGLFPYLRTRHPSSKHAGQIYLPAVNWCLGVAVLLVVVGFGTSSRLSAAYGVAVSGTMLIDVTVFLVLMRVREARRLPQVVGALCGLVVLAFFTASLPKLPSGGWVPVGIGLVLFLVMSTWWSGQRLLAAEGRREEQKPTEVLEAIHGDELRRIEGAAVFLTRDKEIAPIALRALVNLGHTLPERVVLLSWHVEDKPSAKAHEAAVDIDTFGDRYAGIVGVDVALGYRERLDIGHVLGAACDLEPEALDGVEPDRAIYFVSQPIPRLARDGAMAMWRQRLFLVLDRLATDPAEQLALPRARTIVVGREFEL
ncbi:MAG TPA: KUP/HAK/KT family potassium transporter [Nocardioides sp.]|nr:KUP/HAK/KT family potassium transporter [Nocardioides sp.]